MKHSATRALYAYWDRLRAGRAAPERSDLDPGAIRTLLGDVFLLEIGGKDHHVVRLAGTRICTLLGRELKGRPFAEPFAAADWQDLSALLDGVSEATTPAVAAIAGETRDGRTIDLEMLLLPLRHRGRTQARLLGSLVAGEWPYWAGQVPLSRFRLVTLRHLRGDQARPGSADLAEAPPPPRLDGPLRLLPGGRA
jgi:hypothetical protein